MSRGATVEELVETDRPAPGTWKVDAAHSSVGFSARYLMLTKVRGRFADFDATIHVGETPEDSWLEGTIDASSIDTANEMRDGHLRSPDFLDVERFPKLSFRSTLVEQTGQASARVTGDLTIKDVTRPVVLDVTLEGLTRDPKGNDRAAFLATTEIDREEWGITWNQALETGGVLVSKKVGIELEAQAVLTTE